MSLEFDEKYFTEEGMKGYKDFPHFLERANYIKEIINPTAVIVFGGAFGYTVSYLESMGVIAINLETSQYCYDHRTTDLFEMDSSKINWSEYDWIVSWNVLDCLNENNIDSTCQMLNDFEGNQLHIICCDGHRDSEKYKNLNYFIKSHDYWKTKLPSANLICYDCRQTIQGTMTKVPLSWELVSE